MSIDVLFTIISIVVGALASGIPAIIKIRKDHQTIKNSNDETERLAAMNDIQNQMNVFIQAAEIAYKDINDKLKAEGSSAGPIKKDSVMLKLENYATEKEYAFDKEYWSDEIDKTVSITRNVNFDL